MKRWYIAPKSVWEGSHKPSGMPYYCLMAGSSCVELVEGHLLICTDFDNDWAEGEWHAHPEVARLAHPQFEPTVPLAHLHQKPEHAHKQFRQHHFDKLQAMLSRERLPTLDPTHTLWDLHDRISSRFPGLRLNRY